MVAERRYDATMTAAQRRSSEKEPSNVETTTAARRRRSQKEHSNVEANNARNRDESGLKNDCVDEEDTTGVPVVVRQHLLVNGRWVTVTGDDAKYNKKLIVVIAQMERKMDLTVASDSLDVALKQEDRTERRQMCATHWSCHRTG